METEIREPKIKSREKQDHSPTLEALIEKHKLQGTIPNKERVFRAYNLIAERYQLPETFLDDEVNQTLLLGACQKYTESSDPIFRDRLKRYFRTLIAPSMGKERFDVKEIWGETDTRTGVKPEDLEDYLNRNTNQEAVANFKDSFQQTLDKAKNEWARRGYELEFDFKIVSDDKAKFISMTGGTGFIRAPEQDKLATGEASSKITMVLLDGNFDEGIVKHELYHIEDYFDFIRRGKGGEILEGLDEIHTEYSVGRFKENEKVNSYYFDYKNFWKSLSFLGDIEFDLIQDRKKVVDTISEKFGVEGSLIFSLQDATSKGNYERFKTYYSDTKRTIIEMLIAQQKVALRKEFQEGNLDETLNEIPELLEELKIKLSPNKNDFSPEYTSVYDLIKNLSLDVDLNPEKTKKLLKAYSKALALTEMYSQKEIHNVPEIYQQIIKLLGEIPNQRKKPNFNFEENLDKKINIAIRNTEEGGLNTLKEVYEELIFNLNEDINGISFAFTLNNQETRNQILKNYFEELDKISKKCLSSPIPEAKKWFINGFFIYNISYELRENCLNYLSDKYPELKEIIANI